ncbi:MAG: hypothetical protein HRU33_07640 [Rhodobacteraceae bacterium]|nr:hypothetical protein [Paracoccaceae bacterium]
MATKAQLEAELAELRQQLAQQKAAAAAAAASEAGRGAVATDGGLSQHSSDDPVSDPDNPDWEEQLQEFLTGLEDFPQKKPLLLALGALALGYLIGRSR